METIAKVRIRYHRDKKSISRIARKMNLSRATVRKYVDYDEAAINRYAVGLNDMVRQKIGGKSLFPPALE